MLSLSDANESLFACCPPPFFFAYRIMPLRAKLQVKQFPSRTLRAKIPSAEMNCYRKKSPGVFWEYTFKASPPHLSQSHSQLQGSLLR